MSKPQPWSQLIPTNLPEFQNFTLVNHLYRDGTCLDAAMLFICQRIFWLVDQGSMHVFHIASCQYIAYPVQEFGQIDRWIGRLSPAVPQF
jgi:hypothetical protein